jgi:hypothetical protein
MAANFGDTLDGSGGGSFDLHDHPDPTLGIAHLVDLCASL